MSGPLGPSVRNIGSISRWFAAIVLRDIQDDKMGFLPTGLSAGRTGVSPETTTRFDPFEGFSRGNDLQFLFPQGFCFPPLPQPRRHTSTAPSSLANFVVCHLFFFPLCFSEHGLCEFLKLFFSFPSLFGAISHILILLLYWVMWKCLVNCLSWKSASLLLYSVILDIQGNNENPHFSISF